MKRSLPTLLALLALGLLLVAACQAGEPNPAGSAPAAPTQEAAVEQAQPEDSPTPSPPANSQDDAGSESTAESEGAGDGDPEGEAPADNASPAQERRAANADVEFVRATQQADGAWRFEVTVRHPDTGWEDYADGWDVVTPGGQVLKANADDPFTRLLLHPHENEQPFTRSQGGIFVPDGVNVVVVRAHDLVDGYGGREIEVDLTVDQGPGFEVSRG